MESVREEYDDFGHSAFLKIESPDAPETYLMIQLGGIPIARGSVRYGGLCDFFGVRLLQSNAQIGMEGCQALLWHEYFRV